MSSEPSPVLLKYKKKAMPSTGFIVGVLVALLILFLWMHFILAQKIESAGREIQVKTEELHRIERHNHELRRQISIAGSQERLADRAIGLGYQPQRPVYLLVDRPLPPTTGTSTSLGLDLAGIGLGYTPAASGAGLMAESGHGE